MIRRGVMSVWKAILLVVGSLVGVAGATTLGLYVSGGFNPKVVEPQDIYFSEQVEGQAYYLDSANYSAEYKTSSDFYMTIGSNTEDVTEKEVALSFEGQGIASDDYIENGVIKVPKVVSIGTPFKVELVKMYDNSIFADAVVGGTSILTAKSSNILLDSISAQISVDVPVSEFYIVPTGEEKNENNTYVVYSDTEFSVSEAFKPSNSKFLFSDQTKSKLTFFDIQGESISYSYETQKFSAGENGAGSITAYTFSNSYNQRQVLAQYGYTYEEITPAIMENIKTTILADARLAANAQKYKSSSITVQISSATIDSISFVPAGNKYSATNERFETYSNKYLRLTTNSTSVGDATFGVSVTATAGQANAGALLANMGIKIDNSLNISGGKIAKVTSSAVTFENYDASKDYAPTENEIYYLLPNTLPQNYNNYYWQISSEEVGSKTLKLNFFTKDENGVYTNYYAIDGFKNGLSEETEKIFNVSFTERENEEPPAWSDQETISMLINYDADGNIIATSKDLSADIQKTNNWKDNVYQEIRYFIFADNDASAISSEADITNYFVCSLSGEYTKNYLNNTLVVNGTTARAENENYKLYEIPEGMLIATNSFTGEVKVFVATIQTRADGTPILDETKYKIVNTSYVRTIKVESTLSIKNIVSESTGVYIEGTENEDYIRNEAEYYVPALNENIIKLKIALNTIGESDAAKLFGAINVGEAEGGIFFTCVDDAGSEIEDYLTLEGFAQDVTNSTEDVAIFEGTFAINQQLFEPDFETLDRGTRIRIKLSYNNGKEIQSEVLPLFVDGEKAVIVDGENEIVVDGFNVYYPQPVEIQWVAENNTSLYKDANVENALNSIDVNIASNGQTIKWGNDLADPALQSLNSLLQFKLFDQFDKEIEQSAAEYQVLFVETPGVGDGKILNFTADGNQIASFSFAEEQTTAMQAYVYRARRDKMYVYDQSGNVTNSELKYSKTFTFVVTSEGVTKVEYDATTSVNGTSTPALYEESENKGAVSIEKYIKFDNNVSNAITLASLIKVWVGESGAPVSDMHFYFDSTYISSLSSSQNSTTGDNARQSLLKMITITGDDDKTSKEEGLTQIENWAGKKLKSFQFFVPFAQNTNIRLIAKDKDESLFNITIDLVCKPDVYVRNLIESKNAELGYDDYLVGKDNAISIFANEEYELDDIIPVYSISENNDKISWSAILGAKSFDSNSDQIYVADQTLVSLIKKENKIYLKINESKNFVTANITIFIHKTYYAYKVNLRLYINPNIIVVSENSCPTLNANGLFEAGVTLDEYYKIYKATDYITNGGSAIPISITDWTATNLSVSKYIALDLNANKFKAEDATLELELGQTTNQDFILSSGAASSQRDIFGVRKYGSTIVKSDSNALCLTFDLGYEDENQVVQDSEIVKYKNKNYFVFVSGKTYTLGGGFAIYDGQVFGVVDVDNTDAEHKVVAKLNDRLISLDGNGFKVKKEIVATKTLTIVSNINVVVFATGDKFVYYNNGELPTTSADMRFNYYNNATDFETLVTNYYKENDSHTRLGENGYALLEETYFYQVGQQQASYKICQELYAGQTYKILHDSRDFSDDFNTEQVYGFYYDSSKIDNMYNIEISIVEGAEGYIPGIVLYDSTTNEISINHTESEIEAYIVLKLSISRKNSTASPIVWFYRIKVIPSFILGETNYPYAEDSECLDTYSRAAYSNGTYTINFAETLNSANSKYETNKLRIENVSLDLTYYVKPEDIKFVAPSGTKYYSNTACSKDEMELSDDTELTFDGENYSFDDGATYYVRSESVKFIMTPSSYYFDKGCTEEAGTTDADTDVLKDANGNYYFIVQFDADQTFSIKSAFVGNDQISPENYSNYFEYTFVGNVLNITPVDDTTKLTIVVARTLSLSGEDLIGGENTYTLRFNQSKDYVASITPSAGATITQGNAKNFSTTLKADGSTTTFEIDLKERSLNGNILSEVSDFNVYVTEDTSGYFTFAFDNKTISITTESSISADKTFTIVVYTDTQIAFYIDLTIVGNYTITQNLTQVNAGSIVNFADILTIDGEHTITFITRPDGTIVNNTNKNITFSSLTADRNIEFTITIDGGYSFKITLLVKANFEEKSRSYNNTTPQYGQKAFDITLAELKTAFPEFNSDNFFFVDGEGNKIDEAQITIDNIPNVSNSTIVYKTLTLGYYFGDSTEPLFTAPVTYSYTIYKNVNVTAHYPKPAGTELEVEYVSTAQDGDSYTGTITLGGNADFAVQNRIVVEDVASDINHTWSLAITSISNLEVVIGGEHYTSQVGEITGVDENTTINFILSSTFSQGTATFLVSVNKVEVEYNIIVVQGNNFSISTNAPNYASVTDKRVEPVTANAETIYAEDLANQAPELFAQNRILKYALASGVVSGATYYIKLANDTTNLVAMAKITADGTTNTKNIDLGQSYAGYTYKGTYTSYNENTSTFVGNAIDDSQIYTLAPKLTRRVVATYRNGEEITSGITLKAKPSEDAEATELDTLKLEEGDFQKIKTSIIIATINGSQKTTGISYNIYLDTYYSISGVVENENSYTTITLNADSNANHYATSLLTNTSLGISLSEAQMKQYGGSFSLETYGFSALPISEGAPLAIHNSLKEETPISYKTGLTPRAGMELNTGTEGSGDINKNYITIAGLQYNDKIYDYNISPQGASNDGNYVMMRLTYSITISAGQTIQIPNDILFKVLPSSTISFKSGQNSSLYFSSTTITEDNRTIVTNSTTPYTINSNGDEQSFYFNDSTTGSTHDSVIKALMYNSDTNSSNGFTYTFTGNGENWTTTSPSTTGVVLTQKGSGPSPVPTESSVTVQNLVLGERTFYIDATNDFDYKIRFYFKVVAQTNPTVSEMSSTTLTEGDQLVVGAKYQTIVPTTMTIGEGSSATQWAVFEQKDYVQDTSHPGQYVNTISLTYTSGNVTAAIIQASHNGSTVYKKYDSVSSSLTIYDMTKDSNSSNSTWTDGIESSTKVAIDQSKLSNFTLYLQIKKKTDQTKANALSVTYNGKNIRQLLTADTTLQNPAFGKASETTISLAGLKAYAIGDSVGAISTASLAEYQSNVTKIKVKAIKFYYGGNEIGASTYQLATTEETNVTQVSGGANYQFTLGTITWYVLASAVSDGKVKANTPYYTDASCETPAVGTGGSSAKKDLVTSNQVSFYNGSSFDEGAEYSSGLTFNVPTMTNGYLYGTGNTISGVTMKITLVDDENNACDVSEVVTIQRNSDTKLTFTNEAKVYDGSALEVKITGDNETSGDVYNDTLEIELAPGATTTFTITTKDSEEVETTSQTISLTNPETYSVTRYIGIHANVSGISKIQTSFKISVSSNEGATFYYNGENITTETEHTTISTYSSSTLKLHIAHKNELSASNKKTVRLFFLLDESTSITKYQYVQDFEVSPQYTGTNYTNSILIVNDYYKLSNDTDTFYVIPLTSWASFNLSGKDGNGISSAGAYKFHFEIDETLGGSAFIDENGTITTSKNIDLQTEKIFVNVYMKVSGTDGLFEDENGILLDTIVLALNPNVTWNSATQTIAGVYTQNNEIVVLPTEYKAYKASGISSLSGIKTEIGTPTYAFSIDHTLTKQDFENMFGDYALKGTNYYTNPECSTPTTPDTLTSNTPVSKATTGDNYQFKIGAATYYVKASDILKNIWTNRNYHVVYTLRPIASSGTLYYSDQACTTEAGTLDENTNVTKTESGNNYYFEKDVSGAPTTYYVKASDLVGTYQYTNNLNSWTFDSTGTWLINVVVTGRSGDTLQRIIMSRTIYIYDSNVSATEEDRAVQISEGAAILIISGYNEISLTDNSLGASLTLIYTTGIYTKHYLNTSNGMTKTVTWYVCSKNDPKKVAVNVPTSSFRVSNIISEPGAAIYRYDDDAHTMTMVTYETFNNSPNTSAPYKYVAVTGTSINLYNITFYFTNSTTNGVSDVVKVGVNQIANIKGKIANRLNVNAGDITLYTISQTGELSKLTALSQTENYKSYSILAIVSGTPTRYYRYTLNLYGYTDDLEIEHAYSAANSAYALSNLNDEVANEITDTISNSSSITYWTFTDGDNALTAITQEDLSETPNNPYTYYVRLGVENGSDIEIRYYKLSVTYSLPATP